jgi:hypothetical protein
MFSCICGGFVELLYFLPIILVYFFTNFYNKIKYSKFVAYKEKHKSCLCACHKDDLNEEC